MGIVCVSNLGTDHLDTAHFTQVMAQLGTENVETAKCNGVHGESRHRIYQHQWRVSHF